MKIDDVYASSYCLLLLCLLYVYTLKPCKNDACQQTNSQIFVKRKCVVRRLIGLVIFTRLCVMTWYYCVIEKGKQFWIFPLLILHFPIKSACDEITWYQHHRLINRLRCNAQHHYFSIESLEYITQYHDINLQSL